MDDIGHGAHERGLLLFGEVVDVMDGHGDGATETHEANGGIIQRRLFHAEVPLGCAVFDSLPR